MFGKNRNRRQRENTGKEEEAGKTRNGTGNGKQDANKKGE